MFCGNCGTEIKEGMEICPKCNKSHNSVVEKDVIVSNRPNIEDSKIANYPLINLFSKLFYPLFELWLWLSLIAWTVGGGVAGLHLIKNKFYGIIIGFLVGLLVCTISAGLISIFLRINENIENIKKNIKN